MDCLFCLYFSSFSPLENMCMMRYKHHGHGNSWHMCNGYFVSGISFSALTVFWKDAATEECNDFNPF